MKLLDKQCSIIFENKEYDYNTICHGCSKWLSMLEEKKIEKEGVLIFLDMNEKVLYLLIALLSTNNTYIPVDVKMPQERVHSISDQAMPTIFYLWNGAYVGFIRLFIYFMCHVNVI